MIYYNNYYYNYYNIIIYHNNYGKNKKSWKTEKFKKKTEF